MKTWLLVLQQQLSRQIRDNKLPHALLFSGVSGAGHEEIGHWLVNVLLCQDLQHTFSHASGDDNNFNNPFIFQACGQCKCCKLFASESYPDHLTIVSEKSTIGVDLIRKLSQFFQQTAHIGQAKTAIVNHADIMTISAANALLKTLEEPTPDSFIILTTERGDMLLPTIISRCQNIEIRPPVGDKLLAEYSREGGDAFVNLSHMNELNDELVAVAFKEFRDRVECYLCSHQYRAEVLGTLVESNDGFRWLEKIIVNLMRKQWGWQTIASENEQVSVIDDQQLWQIYNVVQAANTKLKTVVQVNRQLLSEKLLVDISVIVQKNEQEAEG